MSKKGKRFTSNLAAYCFGKREMRRLWHPICQPKKAGWCSSVVANTGHRKSNSAWRWPSLHDGGSGVGRAFRNLLRWLWHNDRRPLVTELAESGAGDEVLMSIAAHVSRAMLSRHSHIRMEAKRRALDEIAARQRAADEKRKAEAERRQQAAVAQ